MHPPVERADGPPYRRPSAGRYAPHDPAGSAPQRLPAPQRHRPHGRRKHTLRTSEQDASSEPEPSLDIKRATHYETTKQTRRRRRRHDYALHGRRPDRLPGLGPHDRLRHRRRRGLHRGAGHHGRNAHALYARTGRDRPLHDRSHRRARSAGDGCRGQLHVGGARPAARIRPAGRRRHTQTNRRKRVCTNISGRSPSTRRSR